MIIIIFIIFPLVNTYRIICPIVVQEANVSYLSVQGFSKVVGAVFEKIKMYSPIEYMAITLGGFMNRFAGIDSLAVMIKLTPEVTDFQYGRTIISLFLWPIPRTKERKIIADKAYQRAQKEHTYEKRLDKLIKITFS